MYTKERTYMTAKLTDAEKLDCLRSIALMKSDDEQGIRMLKQIDTTLSDGEILSDKPLNEVAISMIEHPSMKRLEYSDTFEELFHLYFINPNSKSAYRSTYFEISEHISWIIDQHDQFYGFTKWVNDELDKEVYLIK